MFASLISASLKQGNTQYLSKLPRFVLDDLEKQAVDFVLDYERDYHSIPSKARFETEGGGKFILYVTSHLISSPLPDLFDQCLTIKREEHFFSMVHQFEEEISAGQALSPTSIIELGRDLANLQKVEHDNVFDVDRDHLYSEEIPKGLRFGYETLDKTIGGILAGEYGILVARPGVGKTMLLCFMSAKWFREGKKILWISCEMPVEAIVARLDGIIGGFNPKILRTKENPHLLAQYREQVDEAYADIRAIGGNIIFPKNRSVSVSNLWGLISEHRPDVVLVDGLYLMRSEEGKVLSEWQKIKEVSNSLKQIALAENVPIFATSQLKRTGKEDGFNTEDIAYSDALSQDADVILAAHARPGLATQVFLDVMKNRNGDGTASVTLQFQYDVMRCDEIVWNPSTDFEDEPLS